jgi:uncharacterized Zn finger protein (UPF0148 family)
MMWLKSCPKCRGDLFEEHDLGGSAVICLQCGKILSQHEESLLSRSRRRQESSVSVASAHRARAA